MPGPAAHLSIIELQVRRTAADRATYGPVADALNQQPAFAHLGAIGPDMLFWADWNVYTPIVNAVFDAYHTIDGVYDTLSKLWSPIGDAINKVESSLTGGLSDSINDTVDLVKGIVDTAMLDLITHEIDYWETLRPHFQVHSPHDSETNWNWLDYTHHRRTGQFAKRLIDRANASGDSSLKAYSYGWLSHVTADVVGHAFVNLAVGGPWRSHFQRHHLQENFMDVWTWGFYHTPGVSMPTSVPLGGVPFHYSDFTNVGTANFHELINVGDGLPPALQKLLADTLKDVYESIPHPTGVPFLGASEVNRAYQMQRTAFEIMTGKDRHLDAPQPPSVFGDMEPPSFPTPGGSGSGSGGSSGGVGFSLKNLLKAIWDSITGTLEYLADLGLWLVSKITSPLTYPMRYALYLVQLGLYEVYRNLRWALVISGYVYPDPDQLARPEARQFLCPEGRVWRTPLLEYPKERDHSHEYPSSLLEQPAALVAPYQYGDLNYPYWFIEGEKTDMNLEKALAQAANAEQTMELTQILGGAATDLKTYRGSLGSALDLYLRRAREVASGGGGASKVRLPDWNIDSDRGYAFQCWEADTAIQSPPATGVHVTYLS